MKTKILIVDDNSMFTEFLTEYLGIDYDVAESNDAITALNDLPRINPDLILLDHNLGTETQLARVCNACDYCFSSFLA